MPFTFSHPAAVLPIQRLFHKYLSFAGLVIGSVIPDFEYFIRLKSKYSHTWGGVFYFDLPLGIVVAFLFFNVVAPSLVNNLPGFLQARLGGIRAFDWNRHFARRFFAVCLSIVIGALTHILWDSFTHGTGYFVKHYEVLRQVYLIDGIRWPVYRMLQHISTVAGGLVIIIYIMRLPAAGPVQKIDGWYWVTVGIITLAAARLIMPERVYLWVFVISCMSAFLVGLTLAPPVLRGLRKLAERP